MNNEPTKPSEAMVKEFIVDRYFKGSKLAESCKVKAINCDEALHKAKEMYKPKWLGDDSEMEIITFVINQDKI